MRKMRLIITAVGIVVIGIKALKLYEVGIFAGLGDWIDYLYIAILLVFIVINIMTVRQEKKGKENE